MILLLYNFTVCTLFLMTRPIVLRMLCFECHCNIFSTSFFSFFGLSSKKASIIPQMKYICNNRIGAQIITFFVSHSMFYANKPSKWCNPLSFRCFQPCDISLCTGILMRRPIYLRVFYFEYHSNLFGACSFQPFKLGRHPLFPK